MNPSIFLLETRRPLFLSRASRGDDRRTHLRVAMLLLCRTIAVPCTLDPTRNYNERNQN